MLTKTEIKSLTYERAVKWGTELITNDATPALLLGITQTSPTPRMVLCCCEEINYRDIRDLLAAALIGVLGELSKIQ